MAAETPSLAFSGPLQKVVEKIFTKLGPDCHWLVATCKAMCCYLRGAEMWKKTRS